MAAQLRFLWCASTVQYSTKGQMVPDCKGDIKRAGCVTTEGLGQGVSGIGIMFKG